MAVTNTFIVYQTSPKETIRYEIPNALMWLFDEWKDHRYMFTISGPRGVRMRSPTVQERLDALRPDCDELVDQVKVTKTETSPFLRAEGYRISGWGVLHDTFITHFDYPD